MEAIKRRISVRSYSDKPVEESVRIELEEYFQNPLQGPFGAAVRFKMIDLEPLRTEELRPLGTYGIIKGARLYILGAVQQGRRAFEDFGYCMEKVVLKATSLELGTCWLGGTFRRSAFAAKMNLKTDELLPAITPVGYPAQEVSTADRLLRFAAGSGKRKHWDDLFFYGESLAPLPEEEAGDYRDALEAVRMGPSASNRQPWRILKDNAGRFHFYLKENRVYNRILGKIRLQNIDMGIAMCHFEMAAREQALPGRWEINNPAVETAGLRYIATWAT